MADEADSTGVSRSLGPPRERPVAVPPLQATFEEWEIQLHGRRVIYRVAGSGPPVVLIHGMLNSSIHWRAVARRLAERYTVIAPDLIGHGDSAAPRGDYSLGAHAASIRDLLAAIGVEQATIVGHSLGGGVAMQFFYQFPQRVERLALISSGGLGREVGPMLRSAALPGVSGLLSLTIHPRVLGALWATGARMRERGIGAGEYVQAIGRALRPLENADARQAFLHTLRSVIDFRGQRVSATDRLYLLESVPTLVLWGERDHTIPLEHGRSAHEAIPGSHFRTLAKAAHFPHLDDPDGVAEALLEFISATEAAPIEDARWGSVLSRHSPRSRRRDKAAA
jgi:pimeloyl-ACP methyl ester carboxylesterase